MVMEYIPTDLKKHMDLLIEEGERLPQYTVKSYLFQLCNGLYHLSKQGVMHRCDTALRRLYMCIGSCLWLRNGKSWTV